MAYFTSWLVPLEFELIVAPVFDESVQCGKINAYLSFDGKLAGAVFTTQQPR